MCNGTSNLSTQLVVGLASGTAFNASMIYLQDPNLAAWIRIINELRDIGQWKDDWDGENATAPGPELADSAILAILQCSARIEPPDAVSVTPAGAILFVWQRNGEYWEAKIASPTRSEWMYVDAHDHARHWTEPLDPTVVESVSLAHELSGTPWSQVGEAA